ncbi:MAG: lysophospholipase [Actinomycetia bacterium]|nr:lysophospholipase [Actinomycetes bacterium]
MEPETATLVGGNSLTLVYQRWLPDEPADAVVAYIPGVGGHSGQPTYRYLIDYLLGTGRAVYGLDLQGFGRSEGRRGHVEDWHNYIDDVAAFVAVVRQAHPELPLFLFGQSLGGLIALEYAMADPLLAGVVASAPSLAQPNVPAWMPPMVRALAKVKPTLSVNPGLDLAAFTRDPFEVEKLKADPLRHPKVTVRFAVEFEAAVERVQTNADRLLVPLLIIVGSDDVITPPGGSQEFYDRVAAEDKTLTIYDGGYHQPILDTNRDAVLSDISDWITDRQRRE